MTAKKLTEPKLATAPEINKWGVRKFAFDKHEGLFRSAKDFYKRLDMICELHVEWEEGIIGKGPGVGKAWIRDPLAVLQEILDNPGLKDKTVWAPQKVYDDLRKRIYTDLHTSDWWWETQAFTT